MWGKASGEIRVKVIDRDVPPLEPRAQDPEVAARRTQAEATHVPENTEWTTAPHNRRLEPGSQ
jgi:hypothetical protein